MPPNTSLCFVEQVRFGTFLKKALHFLENLRLEEAVEAVVHVAYAMFENAFIAMS